MVRFSRALASLIVALSVLAGCQGTAAEESAPPVGEPAFMGTIVVMPPGVQSKQTAKQVAQRMLDEIHANERRLGRVLVPARVIRVQLLRVGEMYPAKWLDGTNPQAVSLGPTDGPGWVVEAVGTFPNYGTTGQLDSISIHVYHEWDDSGGEAIIAYPCWARGPRPPGGFDGRC